MLHEIKKLVNDEGMVLLYFVPFGIPTFDASDTKIQGVVHMTTPMGLVPIEFDFPPEVKTPEQAYAVFEETAKAYIHKMQEDRPRVVRP
jgi:hypothetical protein